MRVASSSRSGLCVQSSGYLCVKKGSYMHRERVSENVFWFQSELYAQVTAGVIAGPQWAVVIDTLATPEETLAIREFIEHELNLQVRYVNQHALPCRSHLGELLFPGRDDYCACLVPPVDGGKRRPVVGGR